MNQITVSLSNLEVGFQALSGVNDKHLKFIESHFEVSLSYQSKYHALVIEGNDQVEAVQRLIFMMISLLNRFKQLDAYELENLTHIIESGREEQFMNALDDIITRTHTGKPIRAKTLGQYHFVNEVKSHDLTFAIGPAGTGKTYLAVCYAVELLKRGDIKKIILTRPAVEAGENLGFLPGDLKEKVDPYLRPLYDALDDMLSSEKTERYIEKGVIEIAPLAYMRGRTLDDAMVILDEAQNTTKAQMIMFLSRLGRNSKMIVTGDLTQIDLLKSKESGLNLAKTRLSSIKEISFVELTHSDIVRHPLVIKILKAFDDTNKEENNG